MLKRPCKLDHSCYFIYAFVAILLNGCYVEKVLPDDNLIIQKEDKIISYLCKDGTEVSIPPAGVVYEEAFLSSDTLTIFFSSDPNISDAFFMMDQKTPVSEIHSIKVLFDKDKLRYGSFGFGGGGFWEGLFGAGFTFINKNLGGTVRITEFLYPTEELPSDYTGIFKNDNIFMFSFMGVCGGWLDDNRKTWLGVEVGPALVNCRQELETLNPLYGGWNMNKYIRDNIIYNTIGFSCCAKFDLMFTRKMGFEIALLGNINNFKSIFGIEFRFLFGKTRGIHDLHNTI